MTLSSTQRDSEKRIASRTPTTTAAASASRVILSVTHSAGASVAQSATRVCATTSGPGKT